MRRVYLSVIVGLMSISLSAQTENLTDASTWAIFPGTRASEITSSDLSEITVNGAPAIIGDNVRVKFYYNGAAIIPIMEGFSPIALYSGSSQTGTAASASIHTVYKSSDLPLGDDAISSFTLRKGYMATFAENSDGTGRSKVYIAAEDSLSADLPSDLAQKVSFLRVMEWNYVNKRGTDIADQAKLDALGANWFYHWTIDDDTRVNQEFTPMTWGGGTAKNRMDDIIAIENVTHLLGFNESDNCNDQSGQYGDLCQIGVAVETYKNLLKSGLRLGSPSGREGAANNENSWTSLFLAEAQKQNIRIDVVGVHWYDWGNWSANNNPNADPVGIFNRFTRYLTNAHEMYDLPIVITEFNANRNRTHQVNQQFMELAIPWLESTEWIERYCWFQPIGDVANMFDENNNLTDVGLVWRYKPATPSIPESTHASRNLQEVSLFVENRTAVEEANLQTNGLRIYPNPAGDHFTLKFAGFEPTNITLYNMQGQQVHSSRVEGNSFTLSSDSFEPGIYLVKALDDRNNKYTQKVILN